MQEEFTALMHIDMCNDPIEALELKAAAVYFGVVVDRNIEFDAALQKYEITAEQYDEYQPYKGLDPIWD